jgi:hypothetical protein
MNEDDQNQIINLSGNYKVNTNALVVSLAEKYN